MESLEQPLPRGGEERDRPLTRGFLVTPEMHGEMRAIVDRARPYLSPRCGVGPWTAALWELALERRLREGGVETPIAGWRLQVPSRRYGTDRQLLEATWGAWALGFRWVDEAATPFAAPRGCALGTDSIKVRVRHGPGALGQIDSVVVQLARHHRIRIEYSSLCRGLWRQALEHRDSVLGAVCRGPRRSGLHRLAEALPGK